MPKNNNYGGVANSVGAFTYGPGELNAQFKAPLRLQLRAEDRQKQPLIDGIYQSLDDFEKILREFRKALDNFVRG